MTTTQRATHIDLGAGMGSRRVKEPEGPSSFTELPVIDLSAMKSMNKENLAILASEIYEACTKVGFFYIKNHGVSKNAISHIRAEAVRFFHDLDLEQKMELSREKNTNYLGYAPFKDGAEDGSIRAHNYESFTIGREASMDKEYDSVDAKYEATNQWPGEDELPGFRSSISSYFGEMLTLSRTLIKIFALSLNLEESFFDDKIDRPGAVLNLNYYADRREGGQRNNSSILPHTDNELFTILLQADDIECLEVVNSDGVWVSAKPLPGTFVVNIGDALSIWTNNVFMSTLHRATNNSGSERYSIPFFFGPNYDAEMKTLPSCITESRPLKYKTITMAEHFQMKMSGSYGNSLIQTV